MGIEIEWPLVLKHLYQICIAFVAALPVALNREKQARGAGLRTFPLVAVAACGYMLIGINVLQGSQAEGRVLYGIITGMGFIGGGAILKQGNNVTGTATAASLWNTGAIGISVAFERYEITLILSLINFMILRFAEPLKQPGHDD
jgi:putative Mg2+ transporter-C (MgtC) family protein